MSARSKLIVQLALASPVLNEERVNASGEDLIKQPRNRDSSGHKFCLLSYQENVHVTADCEPAATELSGVSPAAYLSNNDKVLVWLNNQDDKDREVKVLQTLTNVVAELTTPSEDITDPQPSFTENFEIERNITNNVLSDDDSLEDKNYCPDESETESEDSEQNESHRHKNRIKGKLEKENDIANNGEDKETTEHADNREEDSNDLIGEKSNSRKRQCRPELWKRNIKKKKVNSGDSYISEGKREVAAKEIKRPCKDSCILKCYNIEEGDRKNIFSAFWGLSDNGLQRQFVAAHLESVIPKYRRVVEGSSRGNNIAYYFTIRGIRRRVCKTFFMNTLNIGDRFIRTTWAKSKDCSIIEKDRRGNHSRHTSVQQSIKDSVRQHINSFHRIESHYLRAQTTREFIDGSLTLAQMYRYYKKEQEDKGLSVAKKSMYESIFNTEFNISFFQPKKDQCSVCEAYKNSNEEEKRKMKAEYDLHIKNKKKSREEKEKDVCKSREDSNTIVACFDLQAVLPTPSGDISTFYYKCRLNCFNFTVFETASKNGYCYFWHEAIASRGANEIATCLMDYLSALPAGADVIFYSDNCVGQNKNRMIVSMYLYTIYHTQINSITHKFLTVGHTQNEGDSMHSVIEKAKKRALKSGPVYVPSQWPPLIRTARKEGRPYKVKELATEEFMDYKSLSQTFGQKFSKNSNNEKVIWNNIQVIRVEKQFPNTVLYKNDFENEEYSKIELTARRSYSLQTFILKKAYANPPVLGDKNKEHLLELCNKNLIEKVHQPFYYNLLS